MRQVRGKADRWSVLFAVGVLLPIGVLFVAAAGSFVFGGMFLGCVVSGYTLGSYMSK